MLICCQPKDTGMHFCDLAETSLERLAGYIFNAAVFDEDSAMMVALVVGYPTELVNVRGELEFLGGLQLVA